MPEVATSVVAAALCTCVGSALPAGLLLSLAAKLLLLSAVCAIGYVAFGRLAVIKGFVGKRRG